MGSVFFENYVFVPNVTLCSKHIFKNECSGFKEGLNKIDNVILSRYQRKNNNNTVTYLMGYSTSQVITIIYYSGIQLFFQFWHNCHVISLTYSSVYPCSQGPFLMSFICIRNYRFWYHCHSLCFNFEIYCS